MKISNSNKGITLVSLVITIVILIILSTIAINFAIGNNGIITRAKETKKMQIIANAKEQIGIEIITAQTEAIERNEQLEQTQIEDIISKYGTLEEDKDTILLKDNNYKISLKEIYNGEISNTGSYAENKAKIALLESQIKELEQKLEESKIPQENTLYQVSFAVFIQEKSSTGTIVMPNTTSHKWYPGGKAIAGFVSNKIKLDTNNKLTLPKGKYTFESFVPVRKQAYGVGYKVLDKYGNTILDHTYAALTGDYESTNFELEEETDITIYWYRTEGGWTDLTYYKIIEM